MLRRKCSLARLIKCAACLLVSVNASAFVAPVSPLHTAATGTRTPTLSLRSTTSSPAPDGASCNKGGRKKVAVIGAGNVGGTTAFLLAQQGLADIVLLDIAKGIAQGKALDISQCCGLLGVSSSITGCSEYEEIQGADVVVVTSGLARKPGMSRDDLVVANSKVLTQVAQGICAHAPQAVVIIVTNPLDVMTYHFLQESKFDKSRVIGMAGLLDSSRMEHFIAEAVGCSARDVSAMVLGGHGDAMVPLVSWATVNGIPVSEFVGAQELQAIAERTANGGAEIVGLLETGSAFYAPAASIAEIVSAILLDSRRVLPCSVLLEGQFGIEGVCLGVPVVLGTKGVERVVDSLQISDSEHKQLQQNAQATKHLLRSVLGYSV